MPESNDLDSIALRAAERILAISIEGPRRPGKMTQFKAAIQCAVRDALEAYQPPALDLRNMTVLDRSSDMGVTVKFASCRAASQFAREIEAGRAGTPAVQLPAGFDRESLQDILDGMDNEPKTVDVGVAHLESSAGYLCRLLRALLVAPPLTGAEGAMKLLRQLKRDLMHARRFSPDVLSTYRRACTTAEGDIEEFLSGAAPARKEG